MFVIDEMNRIILPNILPDCVWNKIFGYLDSTTQTELINSTDIVDKVWTRGGYMKTIPSKLSFRDSLKFLDSVNCDLRCNKFQKISLENDKMIGIYQDNLISIRDNYLVLSNFRKTFQELHVVNTKSEILLHDDCVIWHHLDNIFIYNLNKKKLHTINSKSINPSFIRFKVFNKNLVAYVGDDYMFMSLMISNYDIKPYLHKPNIYRITNICLNGTILTSDDDLICDWGSLVFKSRNEYYQIKKIFNSGFLLFVGMQGNKNMIFIREFNFHMYRKNEIVIFDRNTLTIVYKYLVSKNIFPCGFIFERYIVVNEKHENNSYIFDLNTKELFPLKFPAVWYGTDNFFLIENTDLYVTQSFYDQIERPKNNESFFNKIE